MMIELDINERTYSGAFTTLNEAEAYFRGAEELDGFIRNWSMTIFDSHENGRGIRASYGSKNPVNAAADFEEVLAMERELDALEEVLA